MRFYVIKLKYIVTAVLAAAVIAVIAITSSRAVTTFFTGVREVPIYSVDREDNKIALTFDCAWNDDDIDEIISALNEYNCRATFFVTGKWAEMYQNSLNKLYRNGFEIGLHSYNHDDYTKMSQSQIENDLKRCSDAVMKVTGERPTVARTPSGAYNDTAVRSIEHMNLSCIQWSVDGIDYLDASEQEIYNRIVPQTNEGDIILLHNGTDLTAKLLPKLLESLQRKYTLVNISELLYQKDYTVDNNGVMHSSSEMK